MPPENNKVLPSLVPTVLAGLLLLVPLALIGFILYTTYDVLQQLARASTLDLPFNDAVNGLIIGLSALLLVLALCYFIGLALRTSIGNSLQSRYDSVLEKYLPAVAVLRNLLLQILGDNEDVLKLKPAEVNLYGGNSRQYALVVEELPDGRFAVFVPSVPAATIGQLHILPPDCVVVLDTPVQELLNAVTQWGAGASIIYKQGESSD